MLFIRCIIIWLATFFLASCSTQYSLLPKVIHELKSQAGVTGGDAHIPLKPDLAYRYLRVDVDGRKPALMVLAFEESDPFGSIEVWYSASGQVIKTQQGRIVATSGLQTNWNRVKYSGLEPEWLPKSGSAVQYQRVRDEMPGYKYGLTDSVKLQSLPEFPAIDLPKALTYEQASRFKWFRETSSGGLPNAWYAQGLHRGLTTVVYSEQCLSVKFCLKLLRWPIQENPL